WHRRYRRIPRFLREKLIEPALLALPNARDNPATERFRRIQKFIRGSKDSFPARFLAWNEIFPEATKESLLGEFFRTKTAPAPRLFTSALSALDTDPINRMLYADLTISLPGDMLWKVDMMSMRHALEVRVPLLDPRVVELAFRIGGDWKIRHGRGKYVFIETFKDLLPKSLHRRPKWGFEMPVSRWLKTDLHGLIDTYLAPERIRKQGIFNTSVIGALIGNMMENRTDTSWQIWNLIAFQAWHDSHLR
ncbi:MAG: asparagine synthase C-terminal domain-containing protein, partial [Syntrophales bacterium]|nr:asparagine synthase C-terminal domain-containing protein [Syntrophales bacterium]